VSAQYTRSRKLQNDIPILWATLLLLPAILLLNHYAALICDIILIWRFGRRLVVGEEKKRAYTTISLLGPSTIYYYYNEPRLRSIIPQRCSNARDSRGGAPHDNAVCWIFIELPSQVAHHVCVWARDVFVLCPRARHQLLYSKIIYNIYYRQPSFTGF